MCLRTRGTHERPTRRAPFRRRALKACLGTDLLAQKKVDRASPRTVRVDRRIRRLRWLEMPGDEFVRVESVGMNRQLHRWPLGRCQSWDKHLWRVSRRTDTRNLRTQQ